MAGYDKLPIHKIYEAYERGCDVICDGDRKIAYVRVRSK